MLYAPTWSRCLEAVLEHLLDAEAEILDVCGYLLRHLTDMKMNDRTLHKCAAYWYELSPTYEEIEM